MRKRYQEGSVKKQRGLWIAQWWEEGHRRNRTIGRVSQMTKAEARAELVTIITPINIRQSSASVRITLGEFVKYRFFPVLSEKVETLNSSVQRAARQLSLGPRIWRAGSWKL